MTGKGHTQALATLRHKRASLAGEIASLKAQVEWKAKQLIHVDATLSYLGEGDPSAIKAVKPYKRIPLFKQGELSCLVRDVLRESGKPMRTAEVVDAVTKELGHGHAALPALRPRIRSSLDYLLKGKRALVKAGKGSRVTWSLLA